MSESFAALLDESLSTLEMQPGSIVTGVVLDVDKEWVTVHVGLKSEGVISLDEFRNNDGSVEIEPGDEVQVALEAVEDGYGETRISREKARKIGTWKKLEEALETGEFVEGRVLTRVKGGFSVEVDVVKAFLPGSLVDIRPVKEAPELENTVQEFKVIKLDYKRNNVVLSRKAVLEKINSAENWQSAYATSGSGESNSIGLAFDSSNNLLVTGSFTGAINLGTQLSSQGQTDAFVGSISQSGTWNWAKSVGGSSYDTSSGVVYDSISGLTIMGLSSQSSYSFGSTSFTPRGLNDSVLVSFDSNGNSVALFDAGSTDDDAISGINTYSTFLNSPFS